MLRQFFLIHAQDWGSFIEGWRPMLKEARRTIPRQLNSPQVLFRFIFRLVLLGTFATFGTRGFAAAFSAFLTLSAIYCVITGAMRRDWMDRGIWPDWRVL